MDTLGSRGAKIPGTVDALVAELRNSSALVRVHVLAALGQIGPPATPAAKAIMALLVDPNVHVRRAAVQALREVHPEPAAAVPQLMNVLQDSDPAVKIGATDALAELGKPAVPSLIEALHRGGTAYWASLALSARSAPMPRRPCRPCKKSSRPRRTLTCDAKPCSAWGRSGRRRHPPCRALVRALDEEDRGVRISAVYALGQIGPPAKAAVAPLRKLVDSNQPVFLRTLCVWAVARIDPEDQAALRTRRCPCCSMR